MRNRLFTTAKKTATSMVLGGLTSTAFYAAAKPGYLGDSVQKITSKHETSVTDNFILGAFVGAISKSETISFALIFTMLIVFPGIASQNTTKEIQDEIQEDTDCSNKPS